MIERPPHPFDFFDRLIWLDGRPLMDTIEPYRRRIFEESLYTFGDDGFPLYNRVVTGRSKKNWKTTDLTLSGFYRFFVWPSVAGNDCFVVANDEEQAADDLSLAKKLISANSILANEVDVRAKEIIRRDGRGTMKILPGQDISGLHGKTYLWLGFDEIHGYRDYGLFEALSPDPTRRDVLIWITSYESLRQTVGIPIYDLKRLGMSGADPRLCFSWYSSTYTTDPNFQGDGVTPEQRANPSLANFAPTYLDDQRLRLPPHRFRRLHLNEPGQPDAAALSADLIAEAMVIGRKRLPPMPGVSYRAFADMSSGTADDAVLAIGHSEEGRIVVDLVASQDGKPPFSYRAAVRKFALLCKEYGVGRLRIDSFAGAIFVADFAEHGVFAEVSTMPRTALYERLAAVLNTGALELPHVGILQEQLGTLVTKSSGKIDHTTGDHDDFANSVAGLVACIDAEAAPALIARDRALAPGAVADWGGAVLYAVLWRNAIGEAAAIVCIIQHVHSEPRIVALDIERWPAMSVATLESAVARVVELDAEARTRWGGNLVRAFLYVPPEWEHRADAILDRHLAPIFGPGAAAMMRQGVAPYGVVAIDPKYLTPAALQSLHYSTHAHLEEGLFGFSDGFLAKTSRVPFWGAMAWSPDGREGLADSPLRLVGLLAPVLGLDLEGQPLTPAPMFE